MDETNINGHDNQSETQALPLFRDPGGLCSDGLRGRRQIERFKRLDQLRTA